MDTDAALPKHYCTNLSPPHGVLFPSPLSPSLSRCGLTSLFPSSTPQKCQREFCSWLTSALLCLHHYLEVMGHLEDSQSSCSFESENRRRCNFPSLRPRWALKIIQAHAYSLENDCLIKGTRAKKSCDLVRGHPV